MTPKASYVTKEGLEKLKNELQKRKTILRKEIAERIDRAKELGDLSENAEYAEAKDEQAFNEGRIMELGEMLQNAVVIEEAQGNGDEIHVGSQIAVEINGNTKEYTITGAAESDPSKGWISNESPLGKAFLGHKKGDEVEVDVPSGKATYKITKVN